MMTIRPLLEEALEAAATEHFSHLFSVLMADPSESGLERFRKGLRKLVETEAAVDKMIKHDLETDT
jgi:hypothetical protein